MFNVLKPTYISQSDHTLFSSLMNIIRNQRLQELPKACTQAEQEMFLTLFSISDFNKTWSLQIQVCILGLKY